MSEKLENPVQPDALITIDDYDDYTALGKIIKSVEEVNEQTFLVGDVIEIGNRRGTKNAPNPDLSIIFKAYGNYMTYGKYLGILDNLDFKILKFSDSLTTFQNKVSTIKTHYRVKYVVLKDVYNTLVREGIIHE